MQRLPESCPGLTMQSAAAAESVNEQLARRKTRGAFFDLAVFRYPTRCPPVLQALSPANLAVLQKVQLQPLAEGRRPYSIPPLVRAMVRATSSDPNDTRQWGTPGISGARRKYEKRLSRIRCETVEIFILFFSRIHDKTSQHSSLAV